MENYSWVSSLAPRIEARGVAMGREGEGERKEKYRELGRE